MLAVGKADLQSVHRGCIRRAGDLRHFRNDSEVSDQFAASPEVARDRHPLELEPSFTDRVLRVREQGGAVQVEAAAPLFAIARFCRTLVCSAAPRPLALLMRSSLAAASSSASELMPRC